MSLTAWCKRLSKRPRSHAATPRASSTAELKHETELGGVGVVHTLGTHETMPGSTPTHVQTPLFYYFIGLFHRGDNEMGFRDRGLFIVAGILHVTLSSSREGQANVIGGRLV